MWGNDEGGKDMKKKILVTGATDGIGLETAKVLVSLGHTVLLHGRDRSKLARVEKEITGLGESAIIESYVADLSRMAEVKNFARDIAAQHEKLDVLINNAGVFVTPELITDDGLDIRFAVNTLAPYLLTRSLLARMDASGRVINLSSAAQAPVDPDALTGRHRITSAGAAYAQSKLALTMWSREMARSLGDNDPVIVAVNPGSMLGSKMVKQAYGVKGGDLRIGAEILCKAALSDEFATASGQYFDNDIGQFARPHGDALDPQKCKEVVSQIEAILAATMEKETN
jgi:NAD(P)-dependent dehydrogenase (short-subunit alcohol dehydrogenase family)